jgi:hypothetical protein
MRKGIMAAKRAFPAGRRKSSRTPSRVSEEDEDEDDEEDDDIEGSHANPDPPQPTPIGPAQKTHCVIKDVELSIGNVFHKPNAGLPNAGPLNDHYF